MTNNELVPIIITNTLIVPNTPGKAPYQGWVQIMNRQIFAVGSGEPPSTPSGWLHIDGSNHALVPAFVNLHAHSHSSLTRGSAEGLPLLQWLAIVEQEQTRLTEEEAYIAALATYAEALLSGTASIVDMCLFPEAAKEAAQKIGIRAVIVPYTADSKPFTPKLERTAQLLKSQSNPSARVRIWCGIHDLESCSDEQIRAALELAVEYNVGLHLHCAESKAMFEKTMKRTSQSPIEHLAWLGVFKVPTLLAHCIYVNNEDITIMQKAQVNVAHCPHANLKLGSGIAPVPQMLEAGVNVGLGTDGAKANNSLNMFEVAKFASLVHRGVHRNPSLLPSQQVLAMSSRNGSLALHIDSGEILAGRTADLMLLRLDRFHMQPAASTTIMPNIVFSATAGDVDTVIVDGRIVVQDAELLTADTSQLRRQSSEIGKKLIS